MMAGWRNVYNPLRQIREPDFRIVQVAITAGKTWFYARGERITDAQQGISGGDGVQGSWVMGYMLQWETPTREAIRNWGSGLSYNADIFVIVGGGFIFNPQQPTVPGVYLGIGIGGGPGGSVSYEVK